MTQMGNVITLYDKAIPSNCIPEYPRYEYLTAKGGEETYDIENHHSFADGQKVIPFTREARKGEILRDETLRYKLDISANLIYRGEVLRKCRDNERERELQWLYCASDIRYYFNVFGWTFKPGEEPVPFILYDFQEDIVTWFLWIIQKGLTGLVEKSREMGISWMLEGTTAYCVEFLPAFVAYQLSMTEDEVDDDTCDSLLGKLRFFLTETPKWLRGGWIEKGRDSSGKSLDKKMFMRIPDSKGEVKGKLTGGQSGRSGRANLAAYDEFAHIENAKEVLTASASLARAKLFVSTVEGMGNEFARMAHEPGVLKKSLHWSEHPLKNEKWSILERSKPEYTEETWSQEQEIDYRSSTSGRVYPKLVSRKKAGSWHHVRESGELNGYFDYDPNYDVWVGMDYGLSDPNSVIYCQFKPILLDFPNMRNNILVIFDEDENRDQLDFQLSKMLRDKGVGGSKFKEKGYRYRLMVGDMRTGKRRNSDGTTLIGNLRTDGFDIKGRYNSVAAPIKQVSHRIGLPGALAVNGDTCPLMTQALQNWAFPVDKNTGLPLSGSEPRHDQFSHMNKALAYLLDYVEGGVITKKGNRYKVNWDFNPLTRASI